MSKALISSFQVALIILLSACGNNQIIHIKDNHELINNLDVLVEKQDYFQLKNQFESDKNQIDEPYRSYYSAIINNVFNKAESSNEDMERILASGHPNLSDKQMNTAFHAKLLNHINLYEYAKAAETSRIILSEYRESNSKEKLDDLENELKIWTALEDVPKQTVIKKADTIIPMVRDKVGLLNVDVGFGNLTKPFLFDTGANFSVIVKSQVKELGLRYIDADFYITAATGSRVKSGVAIADKLNISGIDINNVVFLVLDDKDMSFPQIDYYPNGAIGFPVIEALQEIHVYRDNSIFTPQTPGNYGYENLALDGLMPIVAVNYKEDSLSFHLDTGANNTTLFPEFFRKYQLFIENNYKPQILKTSSAGGEVEFQGYKIGSINLKIADSDVELRDILLHKQDIGGKPSHFYGNLGQDFIKKYDKMILSFVNSSVSFE